tara:strand:- start:1063 stop:3810 length:2748 start_codon:yes stop_codon:yes gene_type:complete
MKAFLEKIADHILLKYINNLDKTVVVLPTKRSIVFLKKFIAKKIEKPIFLPQFYTIEQYIESLSGLNVIDNISLQFYLYESYLKVSKKPKSLSDFLSWSSILLRDFNDVDTNLVNPKQLFNNIRNVKELENWKINDWSLSENELSEFQTNYIDFFESMYEIYLDFTACLRDESFAFQGMANKYAAENISNINLEYDKVLFIGLNALTYSEHKIIDFLRQNDVARVFWDADEYYYNNENHAASFFLKKQQKNWQEISFKGLGDYLSIKKDLFQIVSCPHNIAQTKVMSKVLSNIHNDELNKTAIILANEELLFPALNLIPENINKINVTMGSKLKNTAFFSFINSYFNMKISFINYKKDKYYYEDLLKFLDEPLLRKIIDYEKINDFENYIREKNIVFISTKDLIKFFDSKFHNVFCVSNKIIFELNNLKNLISYLGSSFYEDNDVIYLELVSKFSNCLSILEDLIEKFNYAYDYKTFNSIINQLVSKEIIPFQGEPLEGIQLMGILESRTLDFDNLIILGANEGIIPKGKSTNSFIPYELKKYFKMPTYKENDAIFSYHFYRILQRAKNITITYNNSNDNFANGEKSRFLTQLLSEYKYPIKELIYEEENFTFTENKSQKIVNNKYIQADILSWGSKGISPSALNKYIRCSLDFYYHYLAEIKTSNLVQEFADNSLMGNAIHLSLKELYPIGELSLKNFEKIPQQASNYVTKFYEENLSSANYNEGNNYISLKVALKLLSEFFSYEKKQLERETKINILYKEKTYSSYLEIDGSVFKITGNIDRIDMYGEFLRIIDYKTGKSFSSSDLNFTTWDEIIENPKKDKVFQLLLYAYLFLKNNPEFLDKNIMLGILSFRDLKKGFQMIRQNDNLVFNLSTIDKIEEQIIRLIKKIVNDDFIANDNIKDCEYCIHLEIEN